LQTHFRENNRIKIQPLLLLLAALIWGIAFVAQSDGAKAVQPFTFNAVRSALAVAVLLPLVIVRRRKNKSIPRADRGYMRRLAGSSLICGLLLSAATFLQQYAISYVETGKCGFLTALYIVLVPLILMAGGKLPGRNVAAGVVLAVFGLYFLCIKKGSPVSVYDGMLVLCALLFAFQIITIGRYRGDGIELSLGQFIVCTVSSAIGMLFFEKPDASGIAGALLPLMYSGIMSSGVAYTLQIVGMKGMNPTAASLLMSMESVFSVLAAWLFQKQYLSGRELAGCVLMFCAIVLVQIPAGKQERKTKI
jgi:drug/metabolite transporter (DMT)-like permease